MYGLIVNVEFGPHTHPEGCICETVQTWMPSGDNSKIWQNL